MIDWIPLVKIVIEINQSGTKKGGRPRQNSMMVVNKRKVHLSALITFEQIEREEAFSQLKQNPYPSESE